MRVTSHEPRATNKGLTLMEMTVVVAVMALLAVFGLPAIRALINSFESEAGAKAMISAGLASARAIAAKEHHYAGIRFQKAYRCEDPLASPLEGLLEAPQYMIFIVHDLEATGLAPGFRAVEGIKPIKLPDSIGVMDLRTGSTEINSNNDINEERELMDTTTFSIVFSPSGKLVIHEVQVRNRDGEYDTEANRDHTSNDDVFNKKGDVDKRTEYLVQMGMGNEIGMFYQDDYFGELNTPDYPDLAGLGLRPDLGLGPEPSRRSFIIYDKSEFNKVDESKRWSDYLKYLEVIYINPYTGTMIKK